MPGMDEITANTLDLRQLPAPWGEDITLFATFIQQSLAGGPLPGQGQGQPAAAQGFGELDFVAAVARLRQLVQQGGHILDHLGQHLEHMAQQQAPGLLCVGCVCGGV